MAARTSPRGTADGAPGAWTEADPVIELRNAHVIHTSRTGSLFKPDTVHAVNDVSLTVRRGETLGLVGESGCGKSTTARVMVGLQPLTKGEVYFKGKRIGHSAADRKALGRSVSVVFQDPATALNPRMIVHDTLIDPLNVHGIGSPKEREARVRDLLHLVGLPPSALDVLPRQISGGQRQRVAIARALALDPDIIVADEPTSALDVSVRAQVLNLLQDLKATLGLGLVFISHDINTVRYVSDKIAVMYYGRILEMGTTAEIFNNPQENYTRTLLSAVPSLLEG
ncbi:ATP-binding cassette domain-containing protein [Actinomyces gaoshouyii]|uniref:ABC transporter ATP-binding protein n=1 Tax=Actinomyces gaoshouyii TaxID=1960083 RepID=A0A8H9LFD1_9ACTO|nr:ATP-binding cassette domain-containing protein [Actinomyces gaoshouyii]GGO99370.1 ABC transporter ATP-binding protein [Actinomyces gaoshouyii]